MRATFLAFAVVFFAFLVSCSDDDSSVEFLFDREISDLSVLHECAKGADSGAYCYMVQFRYPIDTVDFKRIYLWVDSVVIGDSAKTVNDDKIAKATASFEFPAGTTSLFDTIDLTEYVKDYVEERNSLMVGFYCDYDGGRPGTVQRIYLHFGDTIAPSMLALSDSMWTTGAEFEWTRPTDQTDYYKPNELTGPILGYNIVFHTEREEDIRKLKIKVITPDGVDSTGGTLYKRNSRFFSNNDSVWIKSIQNDSKKYLRIAIPDGKGYNNDNPDSNVFRLIIEGLKPESEYTVAYSSWDTSGNTSGTENYPVEKYKPFSTTDSVAPLMPTKIFTIEDPDFPGMARLDSNNRLRIFWSKSVDPYQKKNGIKVDSLLSIPDTCVFLLCYDTVETYIIEHYDASSKAWHQYDYTGKSGYSKLYKFSGDTMAVSATGKLVTDTIRWVAPGDTFIFRIRSIDKSKYYSVALVDTVYVSPGALAKEIECPEGFLPVKSSDTTLFCMERMEHRNDSGAFMTNVLHSEAEAACEAISASGFTVSLCNERDWEQVCLSGGTYSHGYVQDDTLSTADFLFRNCNVSTADSASAMDVAGRNPRCVNPMGIRDLPGQLQEWVNGRSEDTLAVLKGGSYMILDGIDRDAQGQCVRRSFPVFTRLAYTTDTVYLYREGTKVDSVFEADTSRTPYEKKPFLTKKDFKDTLQFFDVQDSSGNSVGTDYALYSEYKKGGKEWLEKLGNGMKYVPDHIEVVFLTGERVSYRGVADFYKSPSIGFRCCAYKE